MQSQVVIVPIRRFGCFIRHNLFFEKGRVERLESFNGSDSFTIGTRCSSKVVGGFVLTNSLREFVNLAFNVVYVFFLIEYKKDVIFVAFLFAIYIASFYRYFGKIIAANKKRTVRGIPETFEFFFLLFFYIPRRIVYEIVYEVVSR